jgi:hypothetical protein
MLPRVADCAASVAAAKQEIDCFVAEACTRERAPSRLLLVPRAVSATQLNAPHEIAVKTSSHALYPAESPVVAAFHALRQSHCNRPQRCVTKLAGPPSNLCDNGHPDLWRSVPSQLPMNNESCEKETLPHMQKNNSSRLIAAVPAAPQRRAKNCLMRGPF